MWSPFLKAEKIAQEKVGSSTQTAPLDVEKNSSLSRKVIVEIKDVDVIYNAGKNNEARALEGISLEIYAQEYVVFFGPSGCGKSTLLNIVAGLEIPTEGTVLIDDQDIANLSPYELAKFHCRKIGMIFQSYNLVPTLNILGNVVLPQVFERVKPAVRKAAGRALLKKLGLDAFESRLPQELSGGQQQRVGIARALINNPPIILADEAVGNLDSQSASNVLEILNILNMEDKKTIISVTHNPEHLFYADRIFYIKDGKIIKIEINQKRKEMKKESAPGDSESGIKKERTELDLLLQAYPDLSSMQLHVMMAPFKAKMLVAYLLNNLDSEDISTLERVITDRLLNRIKRQELLDILDRPVENGGMGLNKNTVLKFSAIIEKVVKEASYISEESPSIKDSQADPIRNTIDTVRRSLLDGFEGSLNLSQVEALNKGIEYRLLSKISKKEFREYLDYPFEKGGVGLNRGSAKNLARKMEIIMLLQFGK